MKQRQIENLPNNDRVILGIAPTKVARRPTPPRRRASPNASNAIGVGLYDCQLYKVQRRQVPTIAGRVIRVNCSRICRSYVSPLSQAGWLDSSQPRFARGGRGSCLRSVASDYGLGRTHHFSAVVGKVMGAMHWPISHRPPQDFQWPVSRADKLK